MSDFLSRLVQRSFGEVATVRPAPLPVTAPDVGAAAWDEQVIAGDAPLVRTAPSAASPFAPPTRAPRREAPLTHAAPRSAALPLASEDALPPAPPFEGRAHAAPTGEAPPPRAAVATHEVVRASEAPADSRAVAPLASAAPSAFAASGDVMEGAPVTAPPATPSPRGAAPLFEGAPVITRVSHPTPRSALEGLPPLPSEHEGAGQPDRAPRTLTVALDRAPATLAAPPVASPATPAPRREATPAPGTPLVRANGAAPVRLAPAPPPRADAEGAGPRAAPPVVEARTTVEVSIGRIEVRLPARAAPTSPTAASPSRRPVVGLADYLRAREEKGRS